MNMIIIICAAYISIGLGEQIDPLRYGLGSSDEVLREYKRYLQSYKKDLSRMNDFKRVKNFINSYNMILEFQERKGRHSDAFTIGLNHMADWHNDEKMSLFSNVPIPNNQSETQIITSDKTVRLGIGATNWPTLDPPEAVNWATYANPKSVPVVPGVRNQGMCGSCWAFVSSAMAESSVRINTGSKVSLSVQELIDCDTDFNRGCMGGNPIFAFEYIMSEGLTGWYDYPYREQAGRCMRYEFLPRAAVQGYLVISAMNQLMLKRFVSQAPVAVGVCGTDQSFLFYSGHDDATGLDYWIAQNSWGTMWGEKGFIRLLRTNSVGTAGQCGLAMSPSTALGGYTMNLGHQDTDGSALLVEEVKDWVLDHIQMVTVCAAAAMMICSLSLFAFGWVQGSRRVRNSNSSSSNVQTAQTPLYSAVSQSLSSSSKPSSFKDQHPSSSTGNSTPDSHRTSSNGASPGGVGGSGGVFNSPSSLSVTTSPWNERLRSAAGTLPVSIELVRSDSRPTGYGAV
eukprot:gene4172-8291_t